MTHSEFESFDGKETFTAQVDTHVSFPRKLGGVPLIGAGEKSKLIFDPAGNVSYLRVAARELSQGESVPLIAPADADRLAAARYRGDCAGTGGLSDFDLERKLVYYAPSLEQDVARIVPHYSYTGTAKSGGEEISLNGILVPAIRTTGLTARLDAHAEGGRIVASTTPIGGRGPYEYRYGSCATTLDDEAAASGSVTSFALKARAGSLPSRDTISVTVTDADGLTTMASASVDVPAQARASKTRKPLGARERGRHHRRGHRVDRQHPGDPERLRERAGLPQRDGRRVLDRLQLGRQRRVGHGLHGLRAGRRRQ